MMSLAEYIKLQEDWNIYEQKYGNPYKLTGVKALDIILKEELIDESNT